MKLSELFEQNGFDLGNIKESFDLIDTDIVSIKSKDSFIFPKSKPFCSNNSDNFIN